MDDVVIGADETKVDVLLPVFPGGEVRVEVLDLEAQRALLFHEQYQFVEDNGTIVHEREEADHGTERRRAPDLLEPASECLTFPRPDEPGNVFECGQRTLPGIVESNGMLSNSCLRGCSTDKGYGEKRGKRVADL